MHGKRNNRLGNAPILTERLWQQFASASVRKVQVSHDLTDQELADNIGCSAATVGNARNMKGELHGRIFVNLMRVDPYAFEGVLNYYGRRSVPIEAKCDTDELVSTAGAVHKLAAVKSPDSIGGATITDCECLDIEPEIDAALSSLLALKERCNQLRTKFAVVGGRG